jgi:L-fuculose-phosphate aldolase
VYLTDEQIKDYESSIPPDLPEMSEVEHPADELSIRRNISNLVRRSCEQGMMIGSYGTVSVRWKGDDFLITPRNVARWEVDLEDIVQIRDGKREPGKLPSRALKIHARIYRENPGVNSIIITQPPHIMAFGVSDTKLEVRTIPESWFFLRDVPNLDFGHQFDPSGDIVKTITKGTSALVVQNDSIIVTGDKLLQTFDRLEIAESTARSLIMSRSLGEILPMSQEQIDEMIRKFG